MTHQILKVGKEALHGPPECRIDEAQMGRHLNGTGMMDWHNAIAQCHIEYGTV